ncbi:MAG: alpha-E domain-containing protein [Roseiflexaceae bacterium]|jgi:uncharacterized alpha-E superfamily protein|nr:alpha-E domain-containing protein [Chloroflexaceae bacterium]
MAMLSRVADSLYWMSRYLERAEHTARLLDVTLHQLIDVDPLLSQQRWLRLWEALQYDHPMAGSHDPHSVVRLFTADNQYSDAIVSTLTAARENARQVREHISSEMWEQINRLYLDGRQLLQHQRWEQAPNQFYAMIKSGSHLFQGITDATMSHGEGWDFIQIGRAVERANNTANLLLSHAHALQNAQADGRTHHAEWIGLLKMCSAFEAYCKVHTPDVNPQRLVLFVLYDAEFPRSVRFGADTVLDAVARIGQRNGQLRTGRPQRAAGQFQAMLEYAHHDESLSSLSDDLHRIRHGCMHIDVALRDSHIAYTIDSALLA